MKASSTNPTQTDSGKNNRTKKQNEVGDASKILLVFLLRPSPHSSAFSRATMNPLQPRNSCSPPGNRNDDDASKEKKKKKKKNQPSIGPH